jgi:hypothetical protein
MPENTRTAEREARKFIRHPSAIPIRCMKEGHAQSSAGRMENISFGGMAFVVDHPFAPGDILSVQYPSIDRAQGLRGEVVWCRAVDDTGDRRYASGVKFLDEPTHFRARLVEQVCHIEAYRQVQRERCGRELTSVQAAEEWIARFASKFPR